MNEINALHLDQSGAVRKTGAEIAESVLDMVANTPLVRLNRVVGPEHATIYAKLEGYSPGGSIKDRATLNMIEQAEVSGQIGPDSVIVEATSGNTGIGLAMVCAVKGLRCIITMPESMSLERLFILQSFGAEVILTPTRLGMDGAVRRAHAIAAQTKNAFLPSQYKNAANPDSHRKTTVKEILTALDGQVHAFVAGVGTGGTITGVGESLKQERPDTLVVAVEPNDSAVLSGKKPGQHRLQGLGAGFIPEILNRDVIDRIVRVKDEDAFHTTRAIARNEGILCGISSGANLFAAMQIARELGPGKNVVTIFCDSLERYFTVQQYFEF